MRRLLALLLVPALAGCGATAATGDFEGAEREVAQTIADVQAAGQAGDEEKLCDELFAESLVQRLQAGSANCRAELAPALDDADGFELEVQDVTVQGARATARVQGNGGRGTLTLVREGGRWRLAELG